MALIGVMAVVGIMAGVAGDKILRSKARRRFTGNPIKLETGYKSNSAGIPYALLLRIEDIGFPTFVFKLQVDCKP